MPWSTTAKFYRLKLPLSVENTELAAKVLKTMRPIWQTRADLTETLERQIVQVKEKFLHEGIDSISDTVLRKGQLVITAEFSEGEK